VGALLESVDRRGGPEGVWHERADDLGPLVLPAVVGVVAIEEDVRGVLWEQGIALGGERVVRETARGTMPYPAAGWVQRS
jgi:hypothetical protein